MARHNCHAYSMMGGVWFWCTSVSTGHWFLVHNESILLKAHNLELHFFFFASSPSFSLSPTEGPAHTCTGSSQEPACEWNWLLRAFLIHVLNLHYFLKQNWCVKFLQKYSKINSVYIPKQQKSFVHPFKRSKRQIPTCWFTFLHIYVSPQCEVC